MNLDFDFSISSQTTGDPGSMLLSLQYIYPPPPPPAPSAPVYSYPCIPLFSPPMPIAFPSQFSSIPPPPPSPLHVSRFAPATPRGQMPINVPPPTWAGQQTNPFAAYQISATPPGFDPNFLLAFHQSNSQHLQVG